MTREETWRSVVQGTWTEREQFDAATQLWCEYHVSCEECDRKICGVRRDGIAVPTNSLEITYTSKHALQQYARVERIRKRLGIDLETFHRAKLFVCRLSHEQQKDLLRKLEGYVDGEDSLY